jgi:tellurite methyltransferase
MSSSSPDRGRWNLKYEQSGAPHEPSPVLLELERYIPCGGTAIDVAGGAGRHAIWLAQRGLDVTLVDVSDVAIRLAAQRAVAAQVRLHTIHADLQHDPFPTGPWGLILCCSYLQRSLFADFRRQLQQGGTLIVVQPTVLNLERHDRPPREYLLEPNEILQLASGLTVLHHREAWSSDERHNAVLVAKGVLNAEGAETPRAR